LKFSLTVRISASVLKSNGYQKPKFSRPTNYKLGVSLITYFWLTAAIEYMLSVL